MKAATTTLVLTGLMLSVTSVACAAEPQPTKAKAQTAASPRTWSQEPDAFIGIKFDSEFPGAVPACPIQNDRLKTVDFDAIRQNGALCVSAMFDSKDLYSVYGMPNAGFPFALSAFTYGGLVGGFLLTTNGENYAALKAVATTRYGQPTSSEIVEVSTRRGEKFKSERLQWRGAQVDILIDQMSGDINISSLHLNSHRYLEHEPAARQNATSGNGSNL
jgi:hypothetical protein